MELIWQGLVDALRLLATRRRGDAARSPRVVTGRVGAGDGRWPTLIGVPLGGAAGAAALSGAPLRWSPSCTPAWGCRRWWSGWASRCCCGAADRSACWRLIYTPAAMVGAQCICRRAAGRRADARRRELVDPIWSPRCASTVRRSGAWLGTGCARARTQVLVAIAAAFGRAISEVGASLMVGGNILNQTRILTTAITLETAGAISRGRSRSA